MPPPYIKVFQDRANQWRWQLLDDQGVVIAKGPKGYDDKYEMIEAVNDVLSIVRSRILTFEDE
jgi:uncharacterized protein YegP (UPF0339 family)